MNTKHKIEEALRRDLQSATPEYFDKILLREGETPRAPLASEVMVLKRPRKSAFVLAGAALCLLLAGLILFFMLFPFVRYNSVNYMTVDINPAVQFVLSAKGKVNKVNALNYDARIMLSGKLNAFDGLTGEAACEKLVDYAFEYGYFKPDKKTNAMLVSMTLKDEKSEKIALAKASKAVESKFMTYGVYGICLTGVNNNDFEQEAQALGISQSKYRLIKEALSFGVKIDQSEYKNISVSEIYSRMEDLSEKLEEYIDKDLMEEFEDLHKRTEEKLEEFIESIEEKVEALEDAGEQYEELTERLFDLIDIIEDAEKDVTRHLQRLLREVQGIRTPHEGVKALLISIEKETRDFITMYEEGNHKTQEARQEFFDKQNQLKNKNQDNLNNHQKENGFENDYKKWEQEVKSKYFDDWDTLKKQWELDLDGRFSRGNTP